jgi:eukaryotic-like serine/threonine-protein kinase
MTSRSRKKQSSSPDKAGCLGALTIVVLLATVAGLAYMLIHAFSGGFGPQKGNVLVPEVKSMTLEEARVTLTKRNLKLVQGEPYFSDDVEIGRIVAQDPPSNRLVRAGRKITVNISKGPNKYAVPEVVGMTLEQAQSRLTETHLYVGRVEKILNPSMEEGVVVSQQPEAHSKMLASSGIDLVISIKKTEEQVEVPDLVGVALMNAEGLLVSSNLILGRVKYMPHEDVEFGQIVSQDPPAGKQITLGSPVTVEVAIDKKTFAALVKQFRVRVKVPKGPELQKVTIVIEDRLGSSEVYAKQHRVGEVITKDFKAEGDAKLKIYLDGRLIREDIIAGSLAGTPTTPPAQPQT